MGQRAPWVASLLLLAACPACSDDDGPAADGSADGLWPDLFVDSRPQEAGRDGGPDWTIDSEPPDGPRPDLLPRDGPPPASHSKCASPKALALSAGKVSVSDDTSAAVDEHAAVACKNSAGPWSGPQLYYKVSLSAGKTYQAVLSPGSWDGALYAFPAATACTLSAIDSACSGYASDSNGSGGSETVTVAPTAAADWIFVVDSWSSSEAGTFTLKVEDVTATGNSVCAQPQTLTLAGSPPQATVGADTTGAANQFGIGVGCSSGYTFDGPQLYYKVSLTSGKTYQVTATPTGTTAWDVAVYAFPAATACTAGLVDGECKGRVAEAFGAGKAEAFVIKPTSSADWIVVVDSWDPSQAGPFTLKVAEVTPPANATCTGATSVSLASGKVTLSGDTSLAADQDGSSLACGSGYLTFPGNQVFNKVSIASGKTLKLKLAPAFSAYLLLFSDTASCSSSTIETDCASKGATGDYFGAVAAGATQSYTFKPTSAGTYLVAVDSAWSGNAGTFTLELEEITPPTNGACSTPATLGLSGSPAQATATGDTSTTANEFGTSVTCGQSGEYDGRQQYYKVSLVGGKSYQVTATPSTAWDLALYAFPASTTCSASAVDAACKTSLADIGGSGTGESLVLSPTTGADWVLVVDSWSSLQSGAFTLTVKEVTLPSNAACSSPEAVTLSGTPPAATLSAATTLAANEYGTSIACSTGYTFDGGQLYYKVSLVGSKTYKLTLTPASGFDGSLYAFPAATTCSATTIDAACASHAAESGGAGQVETLTLSPTTSADWVVVVDAWSPAAKGSFTLAIAQQ